MEQKQIRRVPVVDDDGTCIGIISLADIAQNARRSDSGEVLHDVSEKSLSASNLAVSGNRFGLRMLCMARHGRAINIDFLDGHAARTPLEELWKLRWNNKWVESDVKLPPE